MRHLIAALALTLVVTVPDALRAQSQRGLKVYISADMEGVVGAVTGDQLGPSGFEYARFREVMTAEVNAAIAAARAAGATEILVSDSHGNGENLLMEKLPQDIQLIRSWPRPLGMMEGIDHSFDAAIFIGYHASTDNLQGVRAHTLSSANLTSVKLNGRAVPEAGLSAAVAGHFGVPVVMISGDDAIAAEARALLGDVEAAVTKWNLGFHSARTLMPEASYALIGEKVTAALARLGDFRPWRLEGPVTLDVSFKNYMPVEVLSLLDVVERVDSHTIRYVGSDMVAVARFLRFMTNYQANLTP